MSTGFNSKPAMKVLTDKQNEKALSLATLILVYAISMYKKYIQIRLQPKKTY